MLQSEYFMVQGYPHRIILQSPVEKNRSVFCQLRLLKLSKKKARFIFKMFRAAKNYKWVCVATFNVETVQ